MKKRVLRHRCGICGNVWEGEVSEIGAECREGECVRQLYERSVDFIDEYMAKLQARMMNGEFWVG